jgi:hypothetical protein
MHLPPKHSKYKIIINTLIHKHLTFYAFEIAFRLLKTVLCRYKYKQESNNIDINTYSFYLAGIQLITNLNKKKL